MLDHIAPLAHLMGIPLYTTEEENYRLARHYYPQVEHRFEPDLDFKLRSLAEEFDALFECKFWAAHLKNLFRDLYKKDMRLIYCPHGQSDKDNLAQYAFQDAALLYGDLMVHMLKELKVQLPDHAFVGNYRYLFYLKHRPFYDHLAKEEIFSKFSNQKPFLLYAPTWKDGNQSTSFFEYGKKVIDEVPSDWNLIVKLHPLLEQRHPAHFYAITSSIERKENVLLVSDFIPVYPILSRCDAYLGDYSSVGYDFLLFQKPLYFLPTRKGTRLHSCGTVLNSNFYSMIEKKIGLQAQQRDLYNHAFKSLTEKEIVKNIQNLFRI